eukprot:6214471-Pleurochrysis_carterae.AAC.2
MHTGVGKKVGETRRKEFASVIGVKCAHKAVRLSRSFVQEGGKRCDEFANVVGGLRPCCAWGTQLCTVSDHQQGQGGIGIPNAENG